MRIRDGFVLRDVVGTAVAVPVGERVVDFNSLFSLNSTGRLLWERLSDGASLSDLVNALVTHYEVTEEQAASDVRTFVDGLRVKGLLAED